MIRTSLQLLLALASAACAPLVGAQSSSELDPAFGDLGVLSLGFQPVDGAISDEGIVACPGPGGTLVAIGLASGKRRVVTAWLRPDGTLDQAISDDGKASFPMPAGDVFNVRGLCTGDGRAYVAFELGDATGDGDIHLVEVSLADGMPAPAFGVAGTRIIDLDTYRADLDELEQPLHLNAGGNGDILLAGNFDRPGTPGEGLLVRVTSQGVVAVVAFLTDQQPDLRNAVAAGPAADGTLWVASFTAQGTTRVFRLAPSTLSYVDTLHEVVGDGFEASSGRMENGGTLLLAGLRHADPERPVAARITADAAQTLELPRTPGRHIFAPHVVRVPSGRYLYAAELVGAGLHFSRFVANSTGALALDESFGSGGTLILAPAFPAHACSVAPRLARLTLWRGQATAIGSIAHGCVPPAQRDRDYLLVRFLDTTVFGDGFE